MHTVIDSRTSTSGEGITVHFQFYQLVPPALDPNPLFGMGFNTFAVFYEFVTGKVDFGPHSFWIATLVETGMIGLTVYLAYFGYTVLSAATMRPQRVGLRRAAGHRHAGRHRGHRRGQLLLPDDEFPRTSS